MRFKKGFTLAEILIVLMVIGALATMTIPSLIKGVTEAQYKTSYRKALNAMINLTTMEKLSGNLPSTNASPDKLFDLLAGSLSVKSYIANGEGNAALLGNGVTATVSNYTATKPTENKSTNWIVSEDNIGYLVQAGAASCKSKMDIIQGQTGNANLETTPCYVIWVDVNGLSAGPNLKIENKAGDGNYVADSAQFNTLEQDQYPIYVGTDGATAGNQKTTVTGRIAADLK